MPEMLPKFIFPFFLCLVELWVATHVRTALNVEQVPQAAAAFLTSGFPGPNLSSFVLLLWGFLNLRSDINHKQASASTVNTPISASRTLLLNGRLDLTAQLTAVFPLIWCQEHRIYSGIMLIRAKLLFPCWVPPPFLSHGKTPPNSMNIKIFLLSLPFLYPKLPG